MSSNVGALLYSVCKVLHVSTINSEGKGERKKKTSLRWKILVKIFRRYCVSQKKIYLEITTIFYICFTLYNQRSAAVWSFYFAVTYFRKLTNSSSFRLCFECLFCEFTSTLQNLFNQNSSHHFNNFVWMFLLPSDLLITNLVWSFFFALTIKQSLKIYSTTLIYRNIANFFSHFWFYPSRRIIIWQIFVLSVLKLYMGRESGLKLILFHLSENTFLHQGNDDAWQLFFCKIFYN